MEKLVSVIVPVYNMEEHLERCINSIINQSYENIEIILINDGSTDNSAIICDSLVEKDRRVKVIHKENEGVSIARNTGLSRANGFYITFVDPDDWISMQLIEQLIVKAEEESCDIVSCCAFIEYKGEKIKNSFFKDNGTVILDKNRVIAQLISNNYNNDSDKFIDIGVPWGKLYRKEYIIKNNVQFKPGLRRMQDNIFNLFAFHYADKIVYIDEPLYFYNFSNIKQESYKHVEDAVELFSDSADETYSFFITHYKENHLFSELTKTKLLDLLFLLLKGKLCNSKYQINLIKRRKLIQNICHQSPFNLIFLNRNIEYSSSRNKLVFYLLKNKAYLTTYLVFRIGRIVLK